jgi:hypothetical protein
VAHSLLRFKAARKHLPALFADKRWGLTEAEQQSMSIDQQRSTLTTQKAEIEALIASKTQSR